GLRPQSRGVALGWSAEQPGVLAAELLGTGIADREGRTGGVASRRYHQPPRLLEAEQLLVLQGAVRGDSLEVLMEARRAHAGDGCGVFDGDRLAEARPDPADGL